MTSERKTSATPRRSGSSNGKGALSVAVAVAGGAVPRALGAERRERIAEMVRRDGVVRVEELSRRFGVSQVTIRGDLDALAHRGVLLRDRGGAIAQTQTSFGLAFAQRATVHRDAKRRIGEAAARLVEPGDTIILDAGTTLMELARSLPAVAPLTVVTSAWNVAAQAAAAVPEAHVMLTGGSLSRDTISTVGPWAERDLSELVVDKVFLGASALDPARGIVGRTMEIARLKAAMVRAARQVILLADASKWGRNAFARVAAWDQVHLLVTDAPVPRQAAGSLRAAGVRIILA